MKTLIKNAQIISMADDSSAYWQRGNIIIENDKILKIEKTTTDNDFDKIIDAYGSIVMPGMVNGHSHAAMTLFRGYADDLPLMEWLERKIFPIEARLTGHDVYWGSMLAMLEMIRSGTTMFADMYFFMEETARAVLESGIRGVLSRGLIGAAPNGHDALRENEELVKNWQGAGEGRITTMFGPHAPYTCPPKYLQEVVALAKEYDVPIHIHLSETEQEVKDILNAHGKRPIELMAENNLFDVPVLAAHCVHLSETEIDLLQKYKVSVAHNPQSNMKLASGIAPIPKMMAKGINICLGTDGASSNNNLDMIDEMRSAALLHKVATMDPTAMPAYEVLKMATINGARALSVPQTGMIKPGYKADLIMIDMQKPHLCPNNDLAANLVYSAQGNDVKTVMVNGKILLEDYAFVALDEEKIMYEASKCMDGLKE